MSDIYSIIDYSRKNPTRFTEELYTNVGTSFTLGTVKRAFLGSTFELRSTPGGAQLTIDVDYELDEQDALYSGAAYEDAAVYTKINILNATYETGNLYVTYDAVLTYVTHAANILHSKLYGKEVGELFAVSGNVKASAQFDDADPDSAFFGLCLDDIADAEVHDVSSDNYPDLVTWARAQRATYLEGQTGETVEFAGSAAASVITFTDNAANNAMLLSLLEDSLVHGGGVETESYTNWRTLDWDGTTYVITDVDTAARTITVTGTPTAGAGTAEFYEHRIAANTTTARFFSMQDRDIAGAGTSTLVSGLRVRDKMQRITGAIRVADGFSAGSAEGMISYELNYFGTSAASIANTVGTFNEAFVIDSADSTNARTSSTTSGRTNAPRMGAHIYIHAGRYIA